MALRPLLVLLALASLPGCTLIDLSQLGSGSGAGQTGGESSAGNAPSGGSASDGGGPAGGSSGVTQGGGPMGGAPPGESYDDCLVGEHPAVYFRLNSEATAGTEPNLGDNGGTGSFSGAHMPFPGLIDDGDQATLFTGKRGSGALAFTGADSVFDMLQPFSLETWVQMPATIATRSLINREANGNRLELRIVKRQVSDGMDAIQLRTVWPTNEERGVVHFLDLENPAAQVLHIVAVFRQTGDTVFNGDGSSDDMAIYVNGELVSDTATGDEIFVPTYAAPITIGNGFEGLLDEVAVYPRELSAADVGRHFAFGKDSSLGCDGD